MWRDLINTDNVNGNAGGCGGGAGNKNGNGGTYGNFDVESDTANYIKKFNNTRATAYISNSYGGYSPKEDVDTLYNDKNTTGGGGGCGIYQSGLDGIPLIKDQLITTFPARSGNGGDGFMCNITGIDKYYGGGGGGSHFDIDGFGRGGLGGGGNGGTGGSSSATKNGVNATEYGSGGGGGASTDSAIGGHGSNGIIIIKYYSNNIPYDIGDIYNDNLYFAGGGSGGITLPSIGGGGGGINDTNFNAKEHSGSGGSGGDSKYILDGGKGGSGIVIIKYQINDKNRELNSNEIFNNIDNLFSIVNIIKYEYITTPVHTTWNDIAYDITNKNNFSNITNILSKDDVIEWLPSNNLHTDLIWVPIYNPYITTPYKDWIQVGDVDINIYPNYPKGSIYSDIHPNDIPIQFNNTNIKLWKEIVKINKHGNDTYSCIFTNLTQQNQKTYDITYIFNNIWFFR